MNDKKEVTIVKVHQFLEWMPIIQEKIAEVPGPKGIEPVNAALVRGVGAFQNLGSEKILSASMQPTDNIRTTRDENGNEKLFAQILVTVMLGVNTSEANARQQIQKQKQPLIDENKRIREQGRDRRSDLLVVEHGKPTNNG